MFAFTHATCTRYAMEKGYEYLADEMSRAGYTVLANGGGAVQAESS